MNKILEFKKEYRWLSNFYPCLLSHGGIIFSNVETAYQANKTLDIHEKTKISLMSPGLAKKYSRTIKLREDWDLIKLSLMELLLKLKFNQEPFKTQLLQTKDLILEEGNYWKDTYWGIYPPGSNNGQNNLGNLLMKIRTELKESQV